MSLSYVKFKNGDFWDCDRDGTIHERAGVVGPTFNNGVWLRADWTERYIDSLQDDIAFLKQYEIRCKLQAQHIEYLKKRCIDNGIEPYPKDV